MFTIGLTGGIGTGKTTVSTILCDLGAEIINADLLGHEVYEPNSDGWLEMIKAFGRGIINDKSEIDRKKLGVIVFNDPDALKLLNAITHPRIYGRIEDQISKISTIDKSSIIVVEAALLIEAGWMSLTDEVWITKSNESNVIKRVQERNSLSVNAIQSRIKSQMDYSIRAKYADVIIENNSNVSELRNKVTKLWQIRLATYCKESRRQI